MSQTGSIVTVFTDPYVLTSEALAHGSLRLTATQSLTTVLICRLMLDLQAANKHATGMSSTVDTHVETVVFQRVVGSLGESICYEDMYGPTGETVDGDVEPSSELNSSAGEGDKSEASTGARALQEA